MGISTRLTDLVHHELRKRHARLGRRADRPATPPPDRSLAQAVAAAMIPANDRAIVRERIRYAGEIYEYLLDRQQDPQWRVIISIARAMEASEHRWPDADDVVPLASRRHRSAGFSSSGPIIQPAIRIPIPANASP